MIWITGFGWFRGDLPTPAEVASTDSGGGGVTDDDWLVRTRSVQSRMTAIQMMKKPIHRGVDISSPSTVTPRMNWRVGVEVLEHAHPGQGDAARRGR